MRIECEDIEVSSYKSNIRIYAKGINFYSMYMENETEEIEKLLNEIQLKELEKYILKRKKENE